MFQILYRGSTWYDEIRSYKSFSSLGDAQSFKGSGLQPMTDGPLWNIL